MIIRIPLAVILVILRMANLVSLKIMGPCPSNKINYFFQHLETAFSNRPFKNAKNVKKLTLSDCTANDEQISSSSSGSSQLSLETSSALDPGLHRWATRWVTRLTTLELRIRSACPELLVACSNSLRRLYLDINDLCTSYLSIICLIGYDDLELPFTLIIQKTWALPEIIRVINTAPVIPHVDLWFHCDLLDVASLDGF